MSPFFIHNGKFHQANETVISPENRSFRYGDGAFETIRLHQGRIPLWNYHVQRVFQSLHTLKFDLPKLLDPEYLHEQVLSLAKKNDLTNARIRITFYRGEGGLTDRHPTQPGFVIQSWAIDKDALGFNSNGLRIGVFEEGRKAADHFSHIKSNNFLVYVQAALHAREKKWNDALVLNTSGRVADSTIANVFWVKDQKLFTPPLSEAPIQGVMRRFLLEQQLIHEQPLSLDDLYQADEVFLTNAVRGIQWVSFVGDHMLNGSYTASALHRDIIAPLFP